MATYNVSPDVNSIIKEYADSIGVKPEEALNKLILTADSRRKALKKYAKTQTVEKKAPKATKGKKEKKAAPKGTSLAKKKAPAKAKKVKGDPKPINIPVVSGGDESAPLP